MPKKSDAAYIQDMLTYARRASDRVRGISRDDFGRLLWSAVGDPALLPDPYGSGWMLNRVSDVR